MHPYRDPPASVTERSEPGDELAVSTVLVGIGAIPVIAALWQPFGIEAILGTVMVLAGLAGLRRA